MRAPQGLIARVGDSCMWFGRYVERAESTARELQATLSLALDGELSPRQSWYPLIVVAGEEAIFRERCGDAALQDGERVQRWLVWDDDCGVSLTRSVGAARENARAIRDVLSADCWEAVNELYLWIGSDGARRDWDDDRDGFYRHVRQDTQLCLGLLRSTMLHDTALDFMWLGMLLERVGQTARLLDVQHHAFATMVVDGHSHQEAETAMWMALLRALSGVEPFMRAHSGRITSDAVAGFLVAEPRFPRSIAYCVHSAHQRLSAIRPPKDHDLPGGEALERLRALDAWVAGSRWLAHGEPLHEKLTHVVDETAAICDTISRELFGVGRSADISTLVES